MRNLFCFRNGFPHQSVTSDIWWYYMISMSFYWSLCVSQFFDVKRKDFWQMFVHHIATIVLMCLSWVVNVWRVGSLVLVVHDSADIFLEVRPLCSMLAPSIFLTNNRFRPPKWQSIQVIREFATRFSPFSPSCGSSRE